MSVKFYWILSLVSVVLFIFDIYMKYIFALDGVKIYFFYDLFSIDRVINYGVAFSLPIYYWLIMFFYILAIPILIYFLYTNYLSQFYFQSISYLLIFLGAISNFIDRIFYHGVIDYLHIYKFSILNVADIMISLGIIFVLISGLSQKNNIQ